MNIEIRYPNNLTREQIVSKAFALWSESYIHWLFEDGKISENKFEICIDKNHNCFDNTIVVSLLPKEVIFNISLGNKETLIPIIEKIVEYQ